MNRIKYLWYAITHRFLCMIGVHRLIHWCQNSSICSEGSDEEYGYHGTKSCDMECFCGKKVGGCWIA